MGWSSKYIATLRFISTSQNRRFDLGFCSSSWVFSPYFIWAVIKTLLGFRFLSGMTLTAQFLKKREYFMSQYKDPVISEPVQSRWWFQTFSIFTPWVKWSHLTFANEAMSLCGVFWSLPHDASMGRLVYFPQPFTIQKSTKFNSWIGKFVPRWSHGMGHGCWNCPARIRPSKRRSLNGTGRCPVLQHPWSLQEHPEVDSLRVGGEGVSEVSHEKKRAPGCCCCCCCCCLGYRWWTKSSIQLFLWGLFSGNPWGNFRIPEN